MTYLITFACYGQHLHGSESGSVDPGHNRFGMPVLEPNALRVASDAQRLRQAPYVLDQLRREGVLKSIQEVCAYRAWSLLAAHVRTTHVHVVVDGPASPERIMGDFKEYASRRLNQMMCDEPDRKRWARHGSTRWLNTPESVAAAMHYVVHEQGDAMSAVEENKP